MRSDLRESFLTLVDESPLILARELSQAACFFALINIEILNDF
jgi:hypothetical protein